MRILSFAATAALGLVTATVTGKTEAPSRHVNKLGDVILLMSGFDNNNGKARCAIFTKDNYLKRATRGTISPIKNQSASCILKGLPHGTYAIAAFHDENNNEKMDTGFLGIPIENGCFSNNATGNFGPASWKDAKFSHRSSRTTKTCVVK